MWVVYHVFALPLSECTSTAVIETADQCIDLPWPICSQAHSHMSSSGPEYVARSPLSISSWCGITPRLGAVPS